EESAVELVQTMCGRDATWVPDPTLMVEGGYPEAIEPRREGEYIFSYTLRSRELVAQIEGKMAQESGLEIVSPVTLAASGEGALGPLEWLGYIKAAKYVITNSYHGTLFSIIFRKPFVFVGLSGAKAGFNERANSLLGRLGLQERMMNSFDETRLESILSSDIDWDTVALEIDRWREQANSYLLNAIEQHQLM
ncbi:polysaccharide pyruvyl transferase family protein, partial [bacterium]|nr:polysaccharide pyruvyl transferase family protein [bacterium]